jgi:hypothetical protein
MQDTNEAKVLNGECDPNDFNLSLFFHQSFNDSRTLNPELPGNRSLDQ